MSPLHRLIPLALLLAAPPALAGSTANEAEHTRLADEMKRLSSRNAWKGVDDAYRELEQLAADGSITLTYRDHYLGASAARELGDVNAVYTRLQRALAVEKTEEATSWLADLNQNYGQVSLKIDAKYPGDRSLSISEMPFDPGQRRVIEAAQLALQNTRAYAGILPLGDYSFGDKKFTISAGGGAAQEVALQAQSVRGDKGGEGGLSYAGPRVDLGVSYTLGSTMSGATTNLEAKGIGGRLGLGWEIGFSTKVGMLAEVGYHGLSALSEPDLGDAAANHIQTSRTQMHLGYGWVAGAFRLGDVRVAVGPSFSVGVLSAVGTGNATDTASVSQSASAVLKGPTYGPGAELGVFYGFLNSSKFQSGLGLHGGAFSDGDRLYSWGQLSFTLAPAAYVAPAASDAHVQE